MEFHYPGHLWALFLLAIPVAIHLFNFRRYKKIKFSNVEMLKKIETESRKTRQLKKYLVLLSRMLFIACLVLAFALPFIPNNKMGSGGKALVAIYVDNSSSMEGRGEQGPLFETSKNGARKLLDLLPDSVDASVYYYRRRYAQKSDASDLTLGRTLSLKSDVLRLKFETLPFLSS